MTQRRPQEEDRSEYTPAPKPEGPAYSGGPWRACCLTSALAAIAILILTIGAGLFSPESPLRGPPGDGDEANRERREAFVRFGREFFAITAEADTASEDAFRRLDAYFHGVGSIEDVHAAFREAADANRAASDGFGELSVPPELVSGEKIRQSLDTMSESYDTRRQACGTILAWDGDINDRATAERYRRQAEEISRLTTQGLNQLGEASRDNGLPNQDVRRFLPSRDRLGAGLFDVTAFPPR